MKSWKSKKNIKKCLLLNACCSSLQGEMPYLKATVSDVYVQSIFELNTESPFGFKQQRVFFYILGVFMCCLRRREISWPFFEQNGNKFTTCTHTSDVFICFISAQDRFLDQKLNWGEFPGAL